MACRYLRPTFGRMENETGTQTPAPTKQAQARSMIERVVGFARARPLTTLAVGAGIAILSEAEWAVGAVVGAAAVALLAGQSLRRGIRDSGHAIVAEAKKHLRAGAGGPGQAAHP
jgi:hypothetical protein